MDRGAAEGVALIIAAIAVVLLAAAAYAYLRERTPEVADHAVVRADKASGMRS